jgi:hypothetical protein
MGGEPGFNGKRQDSSVVSRLLPILPAMSLEMTLAEAFLWRQSPKVTPPSEDGAVRSAVSAALLSHTAGDRQPEISEADRRHIAQRVISAPRRPRLGRWDPDPAERPDDSKVAPEGDERLLTGRVPLLGMSPREGKQRSAECAAAQSLA